MKKELQVPALGIAGRAINGEIALSAVPPAVDIAGKPIALGIAGIGGHASRVLPTCILYEVKVGNSRL